MIRWINVAKIIKLDKKSQCTKTPFSAYLGPLVWEMVKAQRLPKINVKIFVCAKDYCVQNFTSIGKIELKL
jgi:hypothetical protein